MAIVNRVVSQTLDYLASYDYDDQISKLVAFHVDNDFELTLEVLYGDGDVSIGTYTFPTGPTDLDLTPEQQIDVVFDPSTGKVLNIYLRSIS